MQTIVIAGQKGGGGKTTLCINLGVEASQEGKTAGVDTDLQATYTKWHKRRMKAHPESSLHRLEVPVAKLPQALRGLAREGFTTTIIDTSPRRTDEVAEVIKLADLVVIPVRPSLADIEAVIPTARQAAEAKKPFVFVLNGVRKNARQTEQARQVLWEHGRVLQPMLSHRAIFSDCLTGGLSAVEADPRNPATQEVREVWHQIATMLLHS